MLDKIDLNRLKFVMRRVNESRVCMIHVLRYDLRQNNNDDNTNDRHTILT